MSVNEIDLPFRVRAFIWVTSALMALIAGACAAGLVVVVVGVLWIVWYWLLHAALTMTGVIIDNQVAAMIVFASAGLSLFTTFFIRRFYEEPVFFLKITGEVEVDDDEEEEE